MNSKLVKLDYVWIDGTERKGMRTKSRYVFMQTEHEQVQLTLDDAIKQTPPWGFDGSSTEQAEVKSSDLLLNPVKIFNNPFNGNPQQVQSFIVLCEVFNADGTPHESNTRAALRDIFDTHEETETTIFGVEQEYVFWDPYQNWPHGWAEQKDGDWSNEYPEPQGEYYCGLGSKNVLHRMIVDQHAALCFQAGIRLDGTNAEVMKSQWEYQLTPQNAIDAGDSLWVSRYILERIAETRNISINYSPKPVEGDWNGSGCHVNISTDWMRAGPKEQIDNAIELLGINHDKLIEVYGRNNHLRLTGEHETAKIDEFSSGVSDRSVSVRVPLTTDSNGAGHIEDRRPAANMDPYEAYGVIIQSLHTRKEENAEDTSPEVQESEE